MARTHFHEGTGEIIEEPDFIKVYIKELCATKNLTSMQYKIFNFMLNNMNYDNVASYGATTKQKFLDDHKILNQTFNNNISKLIKSCLIERLARGEFRVNKRYAVKVDWSKVQSISWDATYSRKGKEENIKFNL